MTKGASDPTSSGTILLIVGLGSEFGISKYFIGHAGKLVVWELATTNTYTRGTVFKCTVYENGRQTRCFAHGNSLSPVIGFLVKHQKSLLHVALTWFALVASIRLRRRYQACIAVNMTFSLYGLLLRSGGLAKQCIFGSTDFLPPSRGLGLSSIYNRLYRLLDRLSQNSSDAVWYFSPRMLEVEKEAGFVRRNDIPRLVVPISTDADFAETVNSKEIERTSIGYIGKVDELSGLGMVIQSFRDILKRVPTAKLKIIGSGQDEDKFKSMVKSFGLSKHIEFLGFVEDREKAARLLSKCAICIAPYASLPGQIIQFTDPAKVKLYLTCGTPVVMTNTCELADEIREEKAGITIEYDQNAMVQAIVRLLSDDWLWHECAKNVRRLSKKYDYRIIYDKALRETGFPVLTL